MKSRATDAMLSPPATLSKASLTSLASSSSMTNILFSTLYPSGGLPPFDWHFSAVTLIPKNDSRFLRPFFAETVRSQYCAQTLSCVPNAIREKLAKRMKQKRSGRQTDGLSPRNQQYEYPDSLATICLIAQFFNKKALIRQSEDLWL